MRLLVGHSADIKSRDNYGIRTLHIAVQGPCTGVVQTLLNYGAKVRVKDKFGNSALHGAEPANFGEKALFSSYWKTTQTPRRRTIMDIR